MIFASFAYYLHNIGILLMIIRKYGEKILKQKCAPVTGDEILELSGKIDEMVKTMRTNKGAGLAASQVGIRKRFFVAEIDDVLHILFNPKITKKSRRKVELEEGCLSLPGVFVYIKRPEKIEVDFLDQKGVSRKTKAEGLLARVFQHEMDHLDGKLMIDKLSLLERLKLKKQLRYFKNR